MSAPPAMFFDTAYAPFGEPYASTGSTDFSFTGQRQDTVAGLYDFPAREYGYQGRWPSPDPAGLAAVNASNPQSWNRYAYVMNNPLALTDPDGLDPCQGANNFAFSQAANGTGIFSQDDCIANGGTWGDNFLNGPGGGGSLGNGPPGGDTTPGCIPVPNPDPFGSGQPILNCNTDGSSGPGSIAGSSTSSTSSGTRKGNAVYDSCISDFYSSLDGKAVQFFAPTSLIPAWNPGAWSNAKNWAEAIATKTIVTKIAVAGSNTGKIVNYSLKAGTATTAASELPGCLAAFLE